MTCQARTPSAWFTRTVRVTTCSTSDVSTRAAARDAPTWLSDHRIAYHRAVGPLDEQDNAASAVLWAVNLDGSHSRRLSEPGIDGLFEDRYARLSADRSNLMFQRLRLADSKHALFRMNLDGSHIRQLTQWDINADLYDLSTARRGPT